MSLPAVHPGKSNRKFGCVEVLVLKEAMKIKTHFFIDNRGAIALPCLDVLSTTDFASDELYFRFAVPFKNKGAPMAASFTLMYSRLTPRSAAAGGGEVRLLSQGGEGTGYRGTLQFSQLTPAHGDIIRIHAWGRMDNRNGTNPERGRFRLYFNSGTPANISGGGGTPIADSLAVAAIQVPPQFPPGLPQVAIQELDGVLEWHLLAYITIRSASGTGCWSDALVQWVNRPGGSSQTNCN
jgi:hypothetical protein